MQKIISFIEETIDEVKTKVTWPTWSELQSNSALVLLASLIFAIVIGLADFGFKNLMEVLYNL